MPRTRRSISRTRPSKAGWRSASFGCSARLSLTSSSPATCSTTPRPGTEEIARYLLIGMVFAGASVGVRENNHIQVDVLYRYLPARAGHLLSLAVDVVRVAFFASMVWLTAELMREMGDYEMTIVPLPMNILYAVCWLGFAAMTWRSIGVLVAHWKRGHSVLTRPEN